MALQLEQIKVLGKYKLLTDDTCPSICGKGGKYVIVTEVSLGGTLWYTAYDEKDRVVGSCGACIKPHHLDYYNQMNNQTLLGKFFSFLTPEPKKSLKKAGLLGEDNLATQDGIRIYVTNKMLADDDFNSTVVPQLLKKNGDK